eukprot:Unigene11173_Nuclearia_a/m.34186 Unigene11173_Nuclearia_a/g.34186  ORF Unigene11173_Nuclearia_a/g.34186 Unigene11173_Nuclearia_a/m.34186 type:complete len:346 (+) Unigene11173_Nuclearia_a:37-1074(+)
MAASDAAPVAAAPHELGSAAGSPSLMIRQALAGSTARMTAAAIMVPVDTIKTRLQFQGALPEHAVRRYKGVLDAFVAILREEGVRGFYKGLPARLLYIGPAAGVSFGLYEWFKRALLSVRDGTGDTFEPIIPLLAGAGARLFGSSVKTPFDVVKQRLEVQGALRTSSDRRPYRGTIDAFRKILRDEGLLGGLLSGYTVTLLRDVPFAATYFTTYELGKHVQTKIMRSAYPDMVETDLKAVNHLVAGAGAGVAASVLTIPVDAVKTRIQTDALVDRRTTTPAGGPLRGADTSLRLSGIVPTARAIYGEDGWRGFYRGLPARLASVVPSSSITFTIYEVYKRLLGVQ